VVLIVPSMLHRDAPDGDPTGTPAASTVAVPTSDASLPENPRASARAAGLRYVTDDMPGIRRRRRGRGFSYLDPAGKTVRDRAERERFAALAIPPAWTGVWICPRADGHLQATGLDARGRKQYRYHPEWREVRGRTKFTRMLAFGESLPRLRRRIERDLARSGMPRERVLAAVVWLLERSLIRVGNDEYARDNGSYGLTTLRRRHAEVAGGTVRFEFKAKSGRRCETEVDDRRLARIVRRCQELRGQELFTYLDDAGERRDVGSGDVNDYLREVAGEELTAKDFRTWAGTVRATALLRRRCDEDLSEREAKSCVVATIREVADRLANTAATCRKFYIHPAVIDAFLDGSLREHAAGPVPRAPRGLDADERFTLELLRRIGDGSGG
jgi:DNA topoisomerase-1